jgi:hypothetical protein
MIYHRLTRITFHSARIKKKEGLLTWDVVPKILGNYFTFWWRVCFSKGFIDSGLSNYVGEKLIAAGNLSDMSLLFTVTGLMTF